MLQTETDTRTMERRVLRAFRALRIRGARPHIAGYFEHGQWWVVECSTGGQWSACDATGPDTFDGFSFECVTEPEED